MSESGNGFGWVVVELKGVCEPSDPGKGTRGNPEGFVVVKDPPVVGCECGGAVCGCKGVLFAPQCPLK